jgi:hypothetical protein
MATDTSNLIQWLLDLLNDDAAKEDFLRDPDSYLREHGYGDLSSGDIYDSLCLINDRDYDGGRDRDDDDDDHDHRPSHPDHDDSPATYLRNYITNVTNIDDRDTNIDNSIHQDIDTDGGDFDQTIDNDTVVASGDGSTAVGGDNNGNISSAGHDATTSFGDGDATSANFDGADFGSGSAVNVGDGSSHGNAEVNTDVDVKDSFQDNDRYEDNDSLRVEDNSSDDHSSSHIDSNSHNDTDVDDVSVHH